MFNASNPLLHLSRATHYLELGRLAKWGAFAAFAAAFLATRVVLLPQVLLAPALHGGWRSLEPPLFWAANSLLWLLYAMQLFWMWRIARIAATGRVGEQRSSVAGRAPAAGAAQAEEGGKQQQQAPAAVAGPPASPAAAAVGSKSESARTQRRSRPGRKKHARG
jgi:hypothetical protein